MYGSDNSSEILLNDHHNNKKWLIRISAGVLTFGKVISSAALLQLTSQGTFKEFNLSTSIIFDLSVTASAANIGSNFFTRYYAISEKLMQLINNDDEGLADNEPLSTTEKVIVRTIKTGGRLSVVFMSFNTLNAVQEYLYYYVRGQRESKFQLKNDWMFTAPAAAVAFCAAVSYSSFNLKRIDKNAIKFARFLCRDFLSTIKSTRYAILVPLTIMTIINTFPTLSNAYYPTEQAIVNFSPQGMAEAWYMKALLGLSLASAFSSNLFSVVAESYQFLHADHQKRLSLWFSEPWPMMLVMITTLLMLLTDSSFNSIGMYVSAMGLAGYFTENEPVQKAFAWACAFANFWLYSFYQQIPVLDWVRYIDPKDLETVTPTSSHEDLSSVQENNLQEEAVVSTYGSTSSSPFFQKKEKSPKEKRCWDNISCFKRYNPFL